MTRRGRKNRGCASKTESVHKKAPFKIQVNTALAGQQKMKLTNTQMVQKAMGEGASGAVLLKRKKNEKNSVP